MEGSYAIAPLNLGSMEFRLVELQPSEESESIKCRLRSFSFNDDYPAYVALSYAWGRKDRYDDIELNGFQFPVGNNLWWFLHHMRLRSQYIAFWIDAICINQVNVLERNHQVQMMRRIYSSAQSVSVWLGEADNSAYSDIAMQYLAARKPLEGGNFNFGKFWSPAQAKGVLALCERDYWRRIWIVQEIMLAKEATIYCGSKNISWHIFEQLVNDLQILSRRGRETHTLCASAILASAAFVVAKAKSAWDGNLQPLTILLQLYSDHEATNIRDKVYALHGLAKDSADIAINYRIPTKDLLIEVLYHACASRGSRTDIESARKELVRYGTRVGSILKVHCSEDEINFHISTAKQRAQSSSPQQALSPILQQALSFIPRRAPSPIPQRALSSSPQQVLSPSPQRALSPIPQRALSSSPQQALSPSPQRALIPIPQTISSLLYPPDSFLKVLNEPAVYAIDARVLYQALDHVATQPLPDPKLVFPWLHGLHAENYVQKSFFLGHRRSVRKVPCCLRGLTIVKAGGDLTQSKLKGAIAPEELLSIQCLHEEPRFIDIDPREGFSVRNFQIQPCKMATVSDIVVYGDHTASRQDVVDLAKRLSNAQLAWRSKQIDEGNDVPLYSTFIVSDPFRTFEEQYTDIVAIDSKSCMTGDVMDFFYLERLEICTMSKASEISKNVYLGPSPDPMMEPCNDTPSFDILLECSDSAHLPDAPYLNGLHPMLDDPKQLPIHLEFTSSGSIDSPTGSQVEVDSLMETCQWIHSLAHADEECPSDDKAAIRKDIVGDITSGFHSGESYNTKPRRILIHCKDGYTESSLLGLAYFMYAEGLPVHEAWVQLHHNRGRNFFAYPSDVSFLCAIQPRILQESPRRRGRNDIAPISTIQEPAWLPKIDGSLPSRILPHMYLGNLNHANNPELLRELGITHVLSIGESPSWESGEKWERDNLFTVSVHDNGVDPLTPEFERCLKFIKQGKMNGTATLVHDRVGVSRSAAICIAEVMNELGLSFPRAYCFVRARRLNVIIQPNLLFTYELLKWEEFQRQQRGEPLRREFEWATISREIVLLNKPYMTP